MRSDTDLRGSERAPKTVQMIRAVAKPPVLGAILSILALLIAAGIVGFAYKVTARMEAAMAQVQELASRQMDVIQYHQRETCAQLAAIRKGQERAEEVRREERHQEWNESGPREEGP